MTNCTFKLMSKYTWVTKVLESCYVNYLSTFWQRKLGEKRNRHCNKNIKQLCQDLEIVLMKTCHKH